MRDPSYTGEQCYPAASVLYGTENFQPSQTVKQISAKVAADSGMGEVAENAPEAKVLGQKALKGTGDGASQSSGGSGSGSGENGPGNPGGNENPAGDPPTAEPAPPAQTAASEEASVETSQDVSSEEASEESSRIEDTDEEGPVAVRRSPKQNRLQSRPHSLSRRDLTVPGKQRPRSARV